MVRRRLRGELRNRFRFSSFRIRSHGPFPRMAPRIAHSVMRKRDHGLCVRGFFGDAIEAQFVAPGGKWARRLHQALRQRSRNKSC